MMLVGFMVVEDSWWAAGTVHHWDSCNASTCMIPRSSVSGQRPVLGLITPGSEYDLLPRSFLLGIWFTYYVVLIALSRPNQLPTARPKVSAPKRNLFFTLGTSPLHSISPYLSTKVHCSQDLE